MLLARGRLRSTRVCVKMIDYIVAWRKTKTDNLPDTASTGTYRGRCQVSADRASLLLASYIHDLQHEETICQQLRILFIKTGLTVTLVDVQQVSVKTRIAVHVVLASGFGKCRDVAYWLSEQFQTIRRLV